MDSTPSGAATPKEGRRGRVLQPAAVPIFTVHANRFLGALGSLDLTPSVWDRLDEEVWPELDALLFKGPRKHRRLRRPKDVNLMRATLRFCARAWWGAPGEVEPPPEAESWTSLRDGVERWATQLHLVAAGPTNGPPRWLGEMALLTVERWARRPGERRNSELLIPELPEPLLAVGTARHDLRGFAWLSGSLPQTALALPYGSLRYRGHLPRHRGSIRQRRPDRPLVWPARWSRQCGPIEPFITVRFPGYDPRETVTEARRRMEAACRKVIERHLRAVKEYHRAVGAEESEDKRDRRYGWFAHYEWLAQHLVLGRTWNDIATNLEREDPSGEFEAFAETIRKAVASMASRLGFAVPPQKSEHRAHK